VFNNNLTQILPLTFREKELYVHKVHIYYFLVFERIYDPGVSVFFYLLLIVCLLCEFSTKHILPLMKAKVSRNEKRDGKFEIAESERRRRRLALRRYLTNFYDNWCEFVVVSVAEFMMI
jgi:hypothetical protein